MANRQITINPITRVEGHGKVTIQLDEMGQVTDARFHVLQFRGFEGFCRGRPYEEMPVITQRICGICPVSHQLASAKACDEIMGLPVPKAAVMLRELLHMGQYIQSHALHFFYLASPDILLGWDADPLLRNVVGVVDKFPQLAVKGIRLRKFGQEIIKALGGKKVHPAFAVPGGVTNPLAQADRERLLSGFEEAHATCRQALDLFRGWVEKNADEVRSFANFPSNYAGLVDDEGRMALYDGRIRITGPENHLLAEFAPNDYAYYLGEQAESWSYMKFPYYKPQGYPGGLYRVGPLARLHASDGFSTPKASAELEPFWKIAHNNMEGGSLLYHYARLIELQYALERAEALLADNRICTTHIKVTAPPANREGVGVIEAPRGLLIHHYQVDESGALEKVNLIVATGHNNLAMNRSVYQVAREYIRNGEVKEGLLNRVEGAIRCYDPCLSCATHAMGQMPLIIRVLDAAGTVVHELCRD